MPTSVRVPWFAYPESAARALARIVRTRCGASSRRCLRHCSTTSSARRPSPSSRRRSEAAEDTWLGPDAASELLGAYRIPYLASIRATSSAGAVEAAATLGYPVALKIDVPGIVHKTDVGGVQLGLASADEVTAASDLFFEKFASGAAVVVQPMAPAGTETIVGLVEDPSFGPLVMFGLGGTATEVLGDRALSLVPLTRREALGLVGSLRAARLLTGYRGAPTADIDALADLLCRVARLAEDLPEIAEMDLNPVLAGPDGCQVLDCKVRVHARGAGEPELRRRQLG